MNAGRATELLTAHTTNDQVIGGILYRGDSSALDPADAAGKVGFAERKASEAKESDIADALSQVRQRLKAEAGISGHRFNQVKADLAEIGKTRIIPQAEKYEEEARVLRENGKNGVIAAAVVPALLTLGAVGFVLKNPTKWMGRKLVEGHRERKDKKALREAQRTEDSATEAPYQDPEV